MWWQHAIFGFWNGLTAWAVLAAHVLGARREFPLYDVARSGNWYGFGFVIGAGSPLLWSGPAGGRQKRWPDRMEHSRKGADHVEGSVGGKRHSATGYGGGAAGLRGV